MSVDRSLSSSFDFEKYVSKFSIRFIKLRQSREKRDLGIESAKDGDKVERYLKDRCSGKKTEGGGRGYCLGDPVHHLPLSG